MRQTAPRTPGLYYVEYGIDHFVQINSRPPPLVGFSFLHRQKLTQFLPSVFANIAWIPFPFILLLDCTHCSYVLLVRLYKTALL